MWGMGLRRWQFHAVLNASTRVGIVKNRLGGISKKLQNDWTELGQWLIFQKPITDQLAQEHTEKGKK